MGRPPKIDLGKLKSLHRQGLTSTNMAKQFGCSQSAVSQQLKKLGLAAVRNLIVEQAPKFVEEKLGAMQQLDKANAVTLEIIDGVRGSVDRADKALILNACNRIENQVRLRFDIEKGLIDIQVMRDFNQIIIELLGETSPRLRNKFLGMIDEHKALRRALRAKSVKALDENNK